MTRWHVTGLGEGGLRLSASAGELLERADRLDVAIAGAEANVLSSLARLDWNTAWASVLPASPMARRVERELRANGVSLELVSHVADGRLGIYFVEYGSAPRPPRCTLTGATRHSLVLPLTRWTGMACWTPRFCISRG